MSGALAICQTLSGPLYSLVRAAVGEAPVLQIAALAESPWCECHYGGLDGPTLLAIYYGLMGSLPEICRSRLCAQ